MANKISILFTGDFCPHHRIEALARELRFEEIFNNLLPHFKSNDLNVMDLECPLTELSVGRAKTGPHQKAHPACIDLLKFANIGLAAMANNHIMDYGADGLKETMKLCRKNGIATVGVGRGACLVSVGDEEKKGEGSRDPFILETKGRRIAILNFADNEFLTAPDGNLQANPINPVHNFYDIQKAKKENEFVIVVAHGGNEFYHLPSPRIQELYRFYVDAGADAIISHHTHRFSGYELYKGKPIFYGLGNFIYDWPGKVNTHWNRGYLVRLEFTDSVEFEIIPLKQCDEKPGAFQLTSEEKVALDREIQAMNEIIANPKKLQAAFETYCKSVFPMYDAFIEPYFGKWMTALQKRGFLPKLMNRKKRLLLLNITRCESHREVLMNLLKKYE